jgi:cyclase
MNNNYFGEILINDINNDGGMMGFDLRLVKEIQNYTKNPLILVGGGGNWSHFTDVFKLTSVSAVCTQNIFHFTEKSISILKMNLIKEDINIRM